MNVYGLLGKQLSHSFSKKYFTEKFKTLGLNDSVYELFEIPDISHYESLVQKSLPALKGMNVTIPYKQEVIPFLTDLHESAQKVGAVNVIKFDSKGNGHGYNSDYYGFKKSLEETLQQAQMNDIRKALVLGTGGAARAVYAALIELGISFKTVSRDKYKADLSYKEITPEVLATKRLIINTTPLGMYPNVDQCPDIPYQYITPRHILFDLVYNPEQTLFLEKGAQKGAVIKNGLDMLIYQAEMAWQIWTDTLPVKY